MLAREAERIAELDAVYRLADAVAHSQSLDEVLDEAVAALREAVGADRTAVLLTDAAGVMRFRAWRGLSDDYRRVAEGHSPWPPDERDPQPVLVADVAELELEPELEEAVVREGIRSLAFVPLVHQARLVGKFMLYRDEPHEWSAEEILLARTMGSHLASSSVRTQALDELRESRNQLAAVLSSVADGITVRRRGGELLYANEAAARLTGFESPEALLAAADRLDAFELFDENRRPLGLEELPGRRALRGETTERLVLWRIKATGDERWSVVRATPIFGPDGDVELAVNTFHDVTERKVAEDRVRFLGEASEALASSLDYETTLRTVAQLAVPRFADWCVVAIVADDGSIQPIALQHRDPARTADAEEFARRVPPDPDAPVGLAHVIQTGEPELVPEMDDAILEDASHGNAELRERLRTIAPRSAMSVPLVARGRVLGGIVFLAAESGRRYGADDLAAAEDLARRAAAAIDNTLLFREAEAVRRRLEFLSDASQVLAESLDVDETLRAVAELAVPTLAGQCIVDLLDDEGTVRCVAVAHVDPAKTELLRWTRATYPPTMPDHPVQRALRTGEAQLLTLDAAAIEAMAHDEHHAAAIRELRNESGIVVPLIARGRTLGAITLGTVSPQPPYTTTDVRLATDLGRRAATAVDNALLYGAAEDRAHAAQALAFVGDGVFLLDHHEAVRLWNPAAEAITGIPAAAAVGAHVADLLPEWEGLRERIPVAPQPQRGGSRATTLPLDLQGEERWLEISGVRFPGGTVYAFRDVTEERAVERLKTDFVSTVSHELRTPLAAIYGAALTLRRGDLHLEETQRAGLLEVIATEADRLARIVNDILWASRLDGGTVTLTIESCDPVALARQVVDAAAQYAPETIVLELDADEGLPPVAADPDKIRQVLTNLLDNAVKYSPDGGRVRLSLERSNGRLRFAVGDEGLGIPPSEHERIFEKFYRLDPNLTRGVGGTGLGLYICRELVHRMRGGIWVESDGRNGSTLVVELPLAE